MTQDELLDAAIDEAIAVCDAIYPQLVSLDEGWVTINGSPVFIGDGGEGEPLSKKEIAQLSHRGGSKYEQDIAEQAEIDLSKHLGMTKSPDNRPFDLTEPGIGIEVKCFISNSNSKITMKKPAVQRKIDAVKELKLKRTYTVVVDRRTYDEAGKITGVAGPEKYYVRDGYGGFRLNTMKEVTIPELKAYIAKRGTGRFSL